MLFSPLCFIQPHNMSHTCCMSGQEMPDLLAVVTPQSTCLTPYLATSHVGEIDQADISVRSRSRSRGTDFLNVASLVESQLQGLKFSIRNCSQKTHTHKVSHNMQ